MENDILKKSKTQIKQEAIELQKLGEQLLGRPAWQLKQMDLPDILLDALIEGQSITSKNAARRQRQHIGALMRDVDPLPIKKALAAIQSASQLKPDEHDESQTWVSRLLSNEPDAAEALLELCPAMERQRLRQLVRNAQKEQTAGKSKKSFNMLKRFISDSLG